MTRGFGDMMVALQALLPPWAVIALLCTGGLLMLPPWLRSMRNKQIRGLVRRMVRAEPVERAAHIERIRAIAAASGFLWLSVATEARKRSQHDLYREALERLRTLPGTERDIAYLESQTARETKRIQHPLGELVVIERLVDEGMTETAQTRLAEALLRFPGDPDLLAAQARLLGGASAAQEETSAPPTAA